MEGSRDKGREGRREGEKEGGREGGRGVKREYATLSTNVSTHGLQQVLHQVR